jgi:hypothetical protein
VGAVLALRGRLLAGKIERPGWCVYIVTTAASCCHCENRDDDHENGPTPHELSIGVAGGGFTGKPPS